VPAEPKGRMTDRLAELNERIKAAQAATMALDVYMSQVREVLGQVMRTVEEVAAELTEMADAEPG
jgi:CHASE2 domain-containing sensor protein